MSTAISIKQVCIQAGACSVIIGVPRSIVVKLCQTRRLSCSFTYTRVSFLVPNNSRSTFSYSILTYIIKLSPAGSINPYLHSWTRLVVLKVAAWFSVCSSKLLNIRIPNIRSIIIIWVNVNIESTMIITICPITS